MNKAEFLEKLDALQLDKTKYCITSGGAMLIHGLKETTHDIDIKVQPDYFEALKSRFIFKKSPKFDYLYELNEYTEVAVQPFKKNDVDIVDGYPVLKLELELAWKIEHNRPKDKEAIKILKEYLKNNPARAGLLANSGLLAMKVVIRAVEQILRDVQQ